MQRDSIDLVSTLADDRQQLERAIAALEAQRETLGDAVVDIAVAPLRVQLSALSARRRLWRASSSS